MLPAMLRPLRQQWRRDVFSEHVWTIDQASQVPAGEAGGFRVISPEALTAYLKPTRLCDENTPRAANEKIVSDLAFDLDFNVPPVLLYRRTSVPTGEETKCCVSLVIYPSHYPWGMIWDISSLPPVVQEIVRGSIAAYSDTFALDLLIGQTDRNNFNNVVFGADSANPVNSGLLFIDHAFSLNHGNRWAEDNWRNIDMVLIPDLFRRCLDKRLVLLGSERIAALPDQTITDIVSRIPEDYISGNQQRTIITALNGRKQLLREFVDRQF
jgi:hypothetical protein